MKANTKNSLNAAKNIGETIRKRLNEIGIYSLADLATIGSVGAYKKICAYHPEKTFPVCYYLFSLQGALMDIHWDKLPKELKNELLKQIGRG